jgi:hypothetical protein
MGPQAVVGHKTQPGDIGSGSLYLGIIIFEDDIGMFINPEILDNPRKILRLSRFDKEIFDYFEGIVLGLEA